jgi:hypothetical protein
MVMRMTNSTLSRAISKRKSVAQRADEVPAAGSTRLESAATPKAPELPAATGEEKCPVIRANRIVFSSATAGRLRVVFF